MSMADEDTRRHAIKNGELTRFSDFVVAEGGSFETHAASGQTITANSAAKFDCGELLITKAAAEAVGVHAAIRCLVRHQMADWGDLSEDDKLSNDDALLHGCYRLFSEYEEEGVTDRKTVRVWVITDAKQEATTIMLPND